MPETFVSERFGEITYTQDDVLSFPRKQFYIYNTSQYERFLCEQGIFQAEKKAPIDYYKMN